MIFFGAGEGSWSTAAIGSALLLLAIGLVAINMLSGGARAWIAGSAHVVSASEPPANSSYGRCELQIVLDAAGMPAAAVKIRDSRVPVSKWPDAGATLPIMVAIDDPRRVRIQWDDVLTHAEAAEEAGYPAYEDSPTPPRPADDYPAYDDDDDVPLPEDLLGEPGEPPATGTDDLTEEAADAHDEEAGHPPIIQRVRELDREPVIITQTPEGPVVEGRLVERPGSGAESGGHGSIPLPRRKPRPHHQRDAEASRAAAGTAGAAATAAAAAAATAVDSPAADADASVASSAVPPHNTITEPVGDPVTEQVGSDGDADASVMSAYPIARPGPAGAIHGVGITVLVTNLERSVAFYRDMLGFFEIDGGDGNAVLASGDTRLVLRVIPDVTPVNRRVVHLNLEVGDVDATYRELKDKGVRFTYAPRAVNKGELLELWAAAFRDPDGHGIAITQWRSRTHS